MSEHEHPSYGLISITRYTSNKPSTFFGSALKHDHGVELAIKRAKFHRDLSSNWYYGREELISVRLTETQLGELFVNMNSGDGVPCTIQHLADGKRIADPPVHEERALIASEFKKTMNAVAESLDRLSQITCRLAPKMSKADAAALASEVSAVKLHLTSNMPYVQEQFDATLEKSVAEAKASFDAYIKRSSEAPKVLDKVTSTPEGAVSKVNAIKLIDYVAIQSP